MGALIRSEVATLVPICWSRCVSRELAVGDAFQLKSGTWRRVDTRQDATCFILPSPPAVCCRARGILPPCSTIKFCPTLELPSSRSRFLVMSIFPSLSQKTVFITNVFVLAAQNHIAK